MHISATIKNKYLENEISVATEGNKKKINIPGKTEGFGSSVNGGELLFLSLATCFCNDVYREAARKKIDISLVEVTVSGEFGNEGEPATTISYEVNIQSPTHSRQELTELIHYVDRIAEIHTTLRRGIPVTLKM